MKILMICPQNYTKIGGIERHVKEISERLVKNLDSVTVLCVDQKLKEIKEEKINGINVIICPGFAPKGNYHFSWKLYKKIKELNYDIIHCHGYNSSTTPLAILANNKKKKCIVTFHSAGMGLWINNILHIPYTLLMFFLKNKVDKFICVSKFEKDRFFKKLGIPQEKLIVLNNGLDFNEFKSLEKIKIDKNLIIGIGRLEKYKGFQDVIKGFAEAYKENNNLRLEILGNGSYEKNLKELVKKLRLEKVVKIMYLERKETLKHLAKANTFILLSKYEGQPISVLEAIALKKKILLNYRGVLKEFVDGGCALGISNPKDVNEIKNKIFQKVKLRYNQINSWDKIVEQIEQVYKQVLNEHHHETPNKTKK